MRSAAKYIWILIVVAFVGGFLLYETSGLMGSAPVTSNTAVAKVNGDEILATAYYQAVQNLEQQQSQRLGRGLTLDERQQVEDEAYDQLVTDALLRQEYKKRGITVSDQEIVEYAQTSPPPQLLQAPELQTEGQFDIVKYRRFLTSASARQQGALQSLEAYYRSEIPRQKLFEQVASGVYLPDQRLWNIWQDAHDSAQVSYVALRPELIADNTVNVSDDEISKYYEAHKKTYEAPGRAVVSLLSLPRLITAVDTAAAKARAVALRNEIVGGAKFEDVAKRESIDSVSGAKGGDLGMFTRDRLDASFADAAFAMKPGDLSEPVLSQFGYHLIRVDARKGDSVSAHHILIPIQQSDSTASRTDRLADSLSAAASTEDGKKFDAVAKQLGLTKVVAGAIERQPLTAAGRYVPSVSAWAFSGVRPGETSELIDAPDAYYLARLDSLTPGGPQPLAAVRDEIKRKLVRSKKLDALMERGKKLSQSAAAGTLQQAASAEGLQVEQSPMFTRVGMVPGLGQFTQAIGAAFGLPAGATSGPVRTDDGVFVIHVDRRVNADRAAFDAQKAAQRQQLEQSLRETRVREYLAGLKETAKITDNRKQIAAAARRQTPN
jgi:peptidyl-prolyl cis-trans isomerase D